MRGPAVPGQLESLIAAPTAAFIMVVSSGPPASAMMPMATAPDHPLAVPEPVLTPVVIHDNVVSAPAVDVIVATARVNTVVAASRENLVTSVGAIKTIVAVGAADCLCLSCSGHKRDRYQRYDQRDRGAKRDWAHAANRT